MINLRRVSLAFSDRRVAWQASSSCSVRLVENIQRIEGFFDDGGSFAPPVANITLRPPPKVSINHLQKYSATVARLSQLPQCLTNRGLPSAIASSIPI